MPRRERSWIFLPLMEWPLKKISPECSVVWPMIVASSVVLPTPLRPRMARVPFSRTERPISSRTTVSPYPAFKLSIFNKSGMLLFTEVHLAHTLVGADFLRRSLHQHRARREHRDAPGETEHEVHVVLDDQDRDVPRHRIEHLQDAVGLRGRHAGRRLVEQQHARAQAEGDRDLHQALPAVGQLTDAPPGLVAEPEHLDQARGP